ncbi:MAG: ABC transporter transmembrane domain-containing protein [Methylacidiphilales bacterium]|nr:ABC transporter transmembrane domain-containing protein [Candidatus Methylacidiphilales bacterium]
MDNKATPDLTNKEVLLKLFSYTREHRLKYIIAIISLILVAITNAGFAKMMEDVITTIELKSKSNFLAPLILLFFFVGRTVSMILSTYHLTWIGQKIVSNIRVDLFNYLMTMPSKNYDSYRQSEIISMVITRTNSMSQAASQSVVIVFQDFFTILGLIGVMLYQSLLLSLSIVIAVPFMILLFVSSRKLFKENTLKIQKIDSLVVSKLIETVKGYRSIRIYNAQNYESSKFSKLCIAMFKNGAKAILLKSVLSPVMQFTVMVVFIGIVYLSTVDYFSEKITSAAFVSFLFALFMTLVPLKRLSDFSSTYYTILEEGRLIFTFMQGQHEIDTGTKTLNSIQGKIEFKQVCFSYHNSVPILNSVSFKVEPNTIVALVGRSGSGKTTTMNLIPRFYELQTGEILIDDTPIQSFTLSSLRKHISYVGQDIVLNDSTIIENVSYGELSNYSNDMVIEACRKACAHSFIMNLPDGYDSVIGENGQFLSGGQKQRLSIARAFLKKSKIILMDEPTSALDNESDREIREALQSLKMQSSIIVIAHRLSTTKLADQIVVMDQGTIVEVGTHEDLLANGSLYHHLCMTAIK